LSDEPDTGHDLSAAAVQGIRWTAIARPASEVMLLVSMVIAARLIAPAEFGRFSVTLAITEVAMLLPGQGIGAALVQRKEATRRHREAGFALSVLMGVALVGFGLLLAQFVIDPIFGARTAELMRLSTPGFLIAGVGVVPTATLQRELRFKRLSLIDVGTTALRAVTCIALAIAGLQGVSLVIGGLAAAAATTLIAWTGAPPPLPRWHTREARELLSYGLPAALAGVSWAGFRNSDYVIVGARLGAVQSGLYFRAYTLAVDYQKKVSLVMGQVGFPLLARAATPEEQAQIRRQMIRMLTVVLFPLLAILGITAPVLVPWLFGAEWGGAAAPTQILVAGGAATLVIDGVGAALMAQGRSRALLGYGWGHFVCYAVAVFFVCPLGLTAVATAAAVVHTAFLFVAYAMLLRESPARVLRCLWGDIAPGTLCCIALIAVALPLSAGLTALDTPAVLDLFTVGAVAVAVYAFTLRRFQPEAWHTLFAFAGRVLPVDRLRGVGRRLVPAAARS
jgi:lipopolysaccharide exporter